MKIKSIVKNSDTLTTVLLEGTGSWLSILAPKPAFDPSKGTEYSADLDATQAEVDELNTKTGLSKNLKTGRNGTTTVNFKAKGEFKDGNPTPPVAVFDKHRNPITTKVGNGSKVILQVAVVPYKFMGKAGLTTRLVAVQVLEHIPYNEPGGVALDLFDFDDTETDNSKQERLT